MKKALISGITGQDGSYLSELLLSEGYEVYGLIRRKAKEDFENVEHLKEQIHFIYGDVSDLASLILALRESNPDEVYNLAAQSFVKASWDSPLSTAEINALGVTNFLEAIRQVNPKIHFYQASTSEMFGKVQAIPQNEKTPFYPRSPYGVAKLYGHWITINYRESYGLFACSGILFNHESERRGLEFVTRKITHAIAKMVVNGDKTPIELGNLNAKRDWGHSKDYVRAMHLMLLQNKPDDYVIASGETHSVREFALEAFKCAGIEIEFKGENENEIGINKATGEIVIKVNPKFYRPAEVELLIGDAQKAERALNWHREIDFKTLVKLMVENDINLLKNDR